MSAESPATLSVRARLRHDDFELDVDFDTPLAGVTGLFGPSGGGKSTVLRLLAGLEPRAAGQVRVGSETWQDSAAGSFVPAWRRPVGYVFQDARLFPHLTVAGNLDFADRRSRERAGTILRDDVIAALDLGSLLHRDVGGLSGGETQRVAIARTLLARPALLLFDEPLAALDARRKREILPAIAALPARFGIPAIYVSHAIDEMARIADTVLLLDKGRIRDAGEATRVLNELDRHALLPEQDPVTVLNVRVVEHLPDLGLTRVAHDGQVMSVPMAERLEVGKTARLNVRAADVAIALDEPRRLSIRNVLAGRIVALEADAATAFADVAVDIGDAVLHARLTRHAVAELELVPGMPVYALLKVASFDRTGGNDG